MLPFTVETKPVFLGNWDIQVRASILSSTVVNNYIKVSLIGNWSGEKSVGNANNAHLRRRYCVCHKVYVIGVGGGGGYELLGQQTINRGISRERQPSRQRRPHTCRLVRVGCGYKCLLERHFSLFSVIDCETVQDWHNRLQVRTDELILLELNRSTNCFSAFGAGGSQIGGRTGSMNCD